MGNNISHVFPTKKCTISDDRWLGWLWNDCSVAASASDLGLSQILSFGGFSWKGFYLKVKIKINKQLRECNVQYTLNHHLVTDGSVANILTKLYTSLTLVTRRLVWLQFYRMEFSRLVVIQCIHLFIQNSALPKLYHFITLVLQNEINFDTNSNTVFIHLRLWKQSAKRLVQLHICDNVWAWRNTYSSTVWDIIMK